MTIQDVIDKGYKPGMRIKCAATRTDEGTVAPVNEWKERSCGVSVGVDDSEDHLWAYDGSLKPGRWAEIITPAPSKGLQEGDSVECGPAMRAAIVELAEELGVAITHMFPPGEDGVNGIRWHQQELWRHHGKGNYTPEEFIARMRVTAGIPKPEMIFGHKVKYAKGHIIFGPNSIGNETLRAIHGKLKD
jgi:hypothetical protein